MGAAPTGSANPRKRVASTDKESSKATKLLKTVIESTEKESTKAKKSHKGAATENVEDPTNRKQAASTEKESSKSKKSLKAAAAEDVEEHTITCRSSHVAMGVCALLVYYS
jgi:hypothetical protein